MDKLRLLELLEDVLRETSAREWNIIMLCIAAEIKAIRNELVK